LDRKHRPPAAKPEAVADNIDKHSQRTSLDSDYGDYSKYQLYARSEILFLLRSLVQKSCLLTAYFDQGNSFLLTSLLAISEDGNWLYFDYGSDKAVNDRALRADKLTFVTLLDRVKIQFSVAGLQQSQGASGRLVFAAHLPETVLRLQRREFYRLSTPIANPLKCLMPVPKPDGSHVSLSATLLDISGGGVGLMAPTEIGHLLAVGTLISNCELNIPEEGTLHTTLCVRNAFNASTRSGQPYIRLGCEYVDMPGTQLTKIQRYITRVERERKAREAGQE